MGVKRPEIAVPHLTRYDLRPLLCPLQGMTIQPGTDGCITGKSISSQSMFSIANKNFARGWYMVEVLIESDQSYLDTAFVLQHKEGRKSQRLRLPVRNGRVSKRLIWFARGGEELLFSPAQCECDFTIRQLTLVRVSLLFARNRMRSRLTSRQLRVPSRMTNRWACYDATFSPRRVRASYGDWVKTIEPTLWPDSFKTSADLCFSLLMPVSVTDTLNDIRNTIDSVLDQSYQNWKLFILPAKKISDNDLVKFREFVDSNNKIRLIDKALSGAEILKKIIDADTYRLMCPPRAVLSSKALSCLQYVVRKNSHAKIIYADEDLLNEAGRRCRPNFKPAWNPDLLFSRNYIGEFVLFAPGILDEYGPIESAGEVAWDYTLFLRVLRKLENPQREIIHIPRILFHRYKTIDGEQYIQSSRRILKKYFDEIGCSDVEVESKKNRETLHVRWPVQQEEPLVSLLIPTRDMLSMLRQCIDSILEKTTYRNYEILVLDNQSVESETLEYLAKLKTLPNVRVIKYDAPFNYSAINNFGVQHARGEIIGLVNNDTEVASPDWLMEMVGHAIRSEIGCVGAKLHYGDGRIQHAGVVIGLGGLAGHAHKFYHHHAVGYRNRLICTQNFSAVTAACLLVRKSIFEAVGGLDEKHFAVAFNDVDFCLKVKAAGYRNLWTPWAEMYHHESISRGIDNTPEKRARFDREAMCLKTRWSTCAGMDPYYSPFLTHTREDFSLGLNERTKAPLWR
ncbi:glycosyltransferase family 2 protein [uncultured Microbulbifer sp.]|uniref:glycosyltransferase family 2 protein n=1 Tax=uncultured Microbulbifer sp. TaxID=348147 RepID=UPI002614AE29|nr:glycosyltransferase family 2 protein [uncultured Microbulbifer sp.]